MLTSFRNLLRTNDCSALPGFFPVLWPLLTSCGSLLLRIFLPCVRKTSPGTHTFFPSLPAAFTVSDSVQLLGFILSWKLALAYGLICDFYSSGQRFAAAFLQILPHGRHPWLKLYPSRCRADSGLSPFRTCAHRAHTKNACCSCSRRSFYLLRDFVLCSYWRQPAMRLSESDMNCFSFSSKVCGPLGALS